MSEIPQPISIDSAPAQEVHGEVAPVVKPANPEGYETTHQVAKKLLDGPDVIMVLAAPVFDSPGDCIAVPLEVSFHEVSGVDCAVVAAK